MFFGDETYRVMESNAEVTITVARTNYVDKSVEVGRYYSHNIVFEGKLQMTEKVQTTCDVRYVCVTYVQNAF